jgi:hypothetical protein
MEGRAGRANWCIALFHKWQPSAWVRTFGLAFPRNKPCPIFRHSVRVLLLGLLLAIPACSSDSTGASTRYALTITNNTATAYEIFMDTDLDNVGFRVAGTVAAGATTTIPSLTVAAHYTFRLSPIGAGAGAFVYEDAVTSSGANVSWTVP